MTYKTEPWFAILEGAVATQKRKAVALALGVSAPTLSQVLNGSGKYGSGEASTGKLASKVEHTFGRFVCPHLTGQSTGEVVILTASECRAFAHRPAPSGSPRDMQHWQACNQCPHKAHTAPPQQREVKPRKPRTDSSKETP